MKDPMVEEIRQARDEHAKQFNYDLKAIFDDIKKQQKVSGQDFISLPSRRIKGVKGSSLVDFSGTISTDQLSRIQVIIKEGE
ncbi:MAG: hypothetical protein R2880_01065 [Deinococcales bacterium]